MYDTKNKKINIEKLISYGFKEENNIYKYKTSLMNGDFILYIEIINSEIKTKLVEKETKELYTLHLTDSEGNFVGQIRDEYNNVISQIIENCFDNSIFKSSYTYEVINYIKNKYNDDIEYLWEKFPDNGIARRKDNSKWYLAILTVKKEKLGFDSKDSVEVIDLRSDKVEELITENNIFPGYHMNKKHWITIILDGSMDIEKIYNFIDKSYILAKK